jgi:2',3'-cyclic-nucleotide 2'-phosphodiesterase (5'-nucleotidase family)
MIIERGGLKIGMIGATLENTPSMSSPGGLRFGPEIEAVASESRALKRQGADLTIALVHADKEVGQKLMASRVADIIISGHNHDLHVDYDGRCSLTESGEDANFVVAIDIATIVKGEGAARTVAWAPAFRIYDTADVKPDPETLEKVKAFETELSKELDVDVATIGEPLDSRTATVRGGEAAIGNLIADALRIQNHAEVAIINGGGIRANRLYKPGEKLTRRDILAELPFGNKSVVTRIPGKAIWASLENGVSQIEQRAGRFPQISGMTVTVDLNAPVGARVLSIDVGGKPIDEAKVYTVATNDFMLRGGDGYTALADPSATGDTGDRLIANDVMVYARKLGVVNERVEGRIVVK